MLLNSGARLDTTSLGSAVAWMRAHPECGVAGAQLLDPDGRRQNSIANFPTLATELLNKSLLRRLFPKRFPGKEQRFAEPIAVESVIGAFLLVRKSLWDQLGGLDERYFFFLEETDFWLRARRAGAVVMHLPHVQVWHDQAEPQNKPRRQPGSNTGVPATLIFTSITGSWRGWSCGWVCSHDCWWTPPSADY